MRYLPSIIRALGVKRAPAFFRTAALGDARRKDCPTGSFTSVFLRTAEPSDSANVELPHSWHRQTERRMPAQRKLLLVSSLLLVVSAGCREQPRRQHAVSVPEAEPTHATAPAASTTTHAAPEGLTSAPDVVVTLQDGFQLSLASFRGKFVTIFFCASVRSEACLGKARALRDNWRELHEESLVAVLGVSQETPTEQRAFLKEHALPFDLVSDPIGELAQSFGLHPCGDYDLRTLLIGRDGRILKWWSPPNSDSQTKELLTMVSEPLLVR